MTYADRTIERHFLGWDKPVIKHIIEVLTSDWHSGVLDLSDQLFVVPTQNAARRLREALAEAASLRGSAVIPAVTATPDHLFRPHLQVNRIANRAEHLAVWAGILRDVSGGECRHLFPRLREGVAPDLDWLFGTAQRLMQLRQELSENGLTINTAAAQLAEGPESERWEELARLETRFLNAVADASLTDEIVAKIAAANDPQLPDQIRRIRIFAVPDPVPLALQALEKLRQQLPITVYIQAPAKRAEDFDEWGRPLAKAWGSAVVNIPEEGTNLVLKGSPADQAEEVAKQVQTLNAGADDLAVGVPDPDVIPYLEKELKTRGFKTFQPAGEAITGHPVAGLVRALADLLQNRDYRSFAALVRHPDLLASLTSECSDCSITGLLEQMDALQNRHLPQRLVHIARILNSPDGTADYPDLLAAWHMVQQILQMFDNLGFTEGFVSSLSRIYGWRELDPHRAPDKTFADVAQTICQLLGDLATPELERLNISDAQRVMMLLRLLQRQAIYADRENESIDLQGWLELPWEDAPYLFVSGMNDGFAPKSIVGDAFLPDGARRMLGLPDNQQRFARDAYMLTVMIESRRCAGGTMLLVGKTSAQQDALRPSRLLFLCPEEMLAARALRLFGDVPQKHAVITRTIGWQLAPTAHPLPKRLRVTQFRDFLSCPFRFYLRHIVGMDQLDDSKLELDSLDFGTLCHAALEILGGPELAGETDSRVLAERLGNALDAAVKAQFGTDLSAPVMIQIKAARMRLMAAARAQAELNAEGWRTIMTEYRLGRNEPCVINGMRISGTIDRIDVHPSGRIRILDYKTADREQLPDKTLWATCREDTPEYAAVTVKGRAKRWQDLQLPLYQLLLQENSEFSDAQIECGYFNLPKATSETGIAVWQDSTPELLAAAWNCAAGVVEEVRQCRFWPPAEKMRYDQFERLFFGAPGECIDAAWNVRMSDDLKLA